MGFTMRFRICADCSSNTVEKDKQDRDEIVGSVMPAAENSVRALFSSMLQRHKNSKIPYHLFVYLFSNHRFHFPA